MNTSTNKISIFFLSCLLTVAAVGCGSENANPNGPLDSNHERALGKPMPVTMTLESVHTPPGSNAGTFVSTGFLATSGTTSETVSFAASTWHATTTFTDATGSFVIANQGSFAFTSPNTAVGDGNWAVVSGTGAYANLHGTGSMDITIVFNTTGTADLDEIWSGNMFFDNGN